MAIARRFKISHDEVFPYGAYVVGEVGPVFDFDRSTKEQKVQQVDPDTSQPLWSVDVLDADPDAKRSAKTVAVKLVAPVQPVAPKAQAGSPFAMVVFDGLSALPYVDQNGNFARIAWSFRAAGMSAPSTAARKTDGDATERKAA